METLEIENITPPQFREITDADYEKAELDLLRDALKRSYKERFLMMTRLMKMNIMFKSAKIIHKPFFDAVK
jgi:hypothetical protein